MPRQSADWESINVFLPPAKYPTGVRAACACLIPVQLVGHAACCWRAKVELGGKEAGLCRGFAKIWPCLPLNRGWPLNHLPPPRLPLAAGPGVVDALRMKVSTSCPELAMAEGGAAAAGGGTGEDSSGGGGLFGPSTRGRITFGQVRLLLCEKGALPRPRRCWG